MSVQSEINRIEQNVANTYAVLGEKGATMPSEQNSDNLASTAQTIPEQREPVAEKDVNFYDYDGTLLYSYTIAEAQALTELPSAPNPKREFLVFKEWLWTLADIKALNAPIDVGAIYTTVDNSVRVDLSFVLPAEEITLNVSGNPTVDWGDGTVETAVAMGATHIYANAGEYHLKITGGGTLGGGTATTPMIAGDAADMSVTAVYCNYDRVAANYFLYDKLGLTEIVAPKNVPTYAFQNCRRLRHCNLRDSINVGAFRDCGSIKLICIPNYTLIQSGGLRGCSSLQRLPMYTVRLAEGYNLYDCRAVGALNITGTIVGPMAAYGCLCAKKIVVNEGIKSIGDQVFYNCNSAHSIDLASTIESIGAQAFAQLVRAKKFRFRSPTPPTVANANAFTNLEKTCVVEVPKGSLEVYKNATNYASIAAQMVEV